MTETIATQELHDLAKGAIETVGESLAPDEDWMAIAHVALPNGHLSLLALAPELFASGESKDRLARALRGFLIENDALGISLLLSTWLVRVPRSQGTDPERMPPGYPMPSEHPDREETLVLHTIATGEPIIECARIERHEESAPTLKEWENFGGGFFTGRFVEPLRDALKITRRRREEGSDA